MAIQQCLSSILMENGDTTLIMEIRCMLVPMVNMVEKIIMIWERKLLIAHKIF